MASTRFLLLSVLAATSATAARAQLVNGNFEASNSQTVTPPGWTNIGHSDGVIAYSVFGTPAYDGNYYYDLGGYGNANGPVGDGIMQTVATAIGQSYVLTFGLSLENYVGYAASELTVMIGGQSTVYALTPDGSGNFKKPFVTQTINYTATGASTAIKFIETANPSGGFNDPLIDGVSFTPRAVAGVPEPGAWALMLAGFAITGVALRRRRPAIVRFA